MYSVLSISPSLPSGYDLLFFTLCPLSPYLFGSPGRGPISYCEMEPWRACYRIYRLGLDSFIRFINSGRRAHSRFFSSGCPNNSVCKK